MENGVNARAIVAKPVPLQPASSMAGQVANSTPVLSAQEIDNIPIFTPNANIPTPPNVGHNNLAADMTAPQMRIPFMSQGFQNEEEAKQGNEYPSFLSVVVTCTSNSGASGTPTTQTIFNPEIFAPATNNGSGTASMAVNYEDKKSGLLVSTILSIARVGLGAVCFGVQAECSIAGVQDAVSLAQLAPVWNVNTIKGNTRTIELEPQQDHSRADQSVGIEVMRTTCNITKYINFQYSQNCNSTGTNVFSTVFTFYVTRKFKI